jgi:peptidoglycan hydrolase-like protein with peptidoglycan-binding domain
MSILLILEIDERGPATREAIAKFQRDHKLEPNGKISGDLLVHLARAVQKQ